MTGRGPIGPVLFVDEVYPLLSSDLGRTARLPGVLCGCGRPARLVADVEVRISPWDTQRQHVLLCDLASCWLDTATDASIVDVALLTREAAEAVSGLDLGEVAA